MVYILTFTLTAICCWRFQANHERKRYVVAWIFSILTIIIPSVLAGFRDISVGTDNLVYSTWFSWISCVSNPIAAFKSISVEPGYILLNYIISRFTNNYHWICFVAELLSTGFIFAGLYYYRRIIPMWLGMITFLFTQYCNFYNIMRQGIAVAICFYAIKYAINKKIILYFIFIGIATLFHTSAIIAIPIYFLFRILNGKNDAVKMFFIISFLLVLTFLLPQIVKMAVANGIISSKYLAYVGNGMSLSFYHFILRLPILIFASFIYKPLINKFIGYKYLYIMIWAEMILAQLGGSFDPAYRVSLYFNCAIFVVIPCSVNVVKNNILNKSICICGIIIYLFGYWYLQTVLNGYGFSSPVYPYVSDLL